MTRFLAAVGVGAVIAGLLVLGSTPVSAVEATSEQSIVEQWRQTRVAELTGEHGWLSLVGLFWLDNGDNSFGRSRHNRLVLDHPALAPVAGTFALNSGHIQFTAHHGSGVTHGGQPVTSLDMVPDSEGEPTVISSGSLRIWIIGRGGKLGVRVRDVDSPRRRRFTAINYYPIDTAWVFDARFEPYEPHRRVKIVNILGMDEELDCPGTLVFNKDGREWRLDAVLEDPHDQTLFVMFADRTNGNGTYGGGRFLRVPLPSQGTTRVDFNQAYNPPCAFNDFATCPLPPEQNKLALRVESGEKVYGNGPGGH